MDNYWNQRWKQFVEVEYHAQKRAWFNLKTSIMWIAVAIIVGLLVGGFSSLFAYSLSKIVSIRETNEYLIYFLPFGGLVIVFLYRICGFKKDPGTNILLSAVHESDQDVPPFIAPLIFIGTLITHLFGGSAGREGAALQMGGSLGNSIGRILKLNEGDRKIVVLSGMSAAFSAVFGTPLAAAIFPMEMVSVGIMHYAALVPCVFASIVANLFASNMGIKESVMVIQGIPELTVINFAKIILLGICCAFLSIMFCMVLRKVSMLYSHFFTNAYVKVFVGGVLMILCTKMLGTMIFCGAGNNLIRDAICGDVPSYSFLVKMFLTAITLTAGYKGGEIVPSFCIGATFGCVFGQFFGISPSLCAAVGMIAMFCGVTNCPIASMLIGFELFGFEGVLFLLVAISISYMFSGYKGLYREQIIVYSKLHPKYINRLSGDDSFSGIDYEDE